MLFAITFAALYAIVIFSPFFLSGGRRRRRSDHSGNTGSELADIVFQNQLLIITFILILAVLVSFGAWVINKDKKQLAGIIFDDPSRMVRLNYKKYYSGILHSHEVPYDELVFHIAKKKNMFAGLNYIIVEFADRQGYICRLDTSNELWDSETKQAKDIIEKLRNI